MRTRDLFARLAALNIAVVLLITAVLAATLGGFPGHPIRVIAAVIGTAAIAVAAAALVTRSVTTEIELPVGKLAEQLSRRVDDLRNETLLREEILDAMEEAVVLEDDGTVVFANRAAQRLLGAVDGRPLPPQLARADAFRDGSADFTLHHPITRELRATAAPLPDGRTLFVAQDVTEARRIDRIRRDFVANASHELKTPVAGILASAETLREAIGEDRAAAERFAANLAKEAARLSNLVQDLLDLARLDQTPGEETMVSMSAIVADVVEEVRPQVEKKGLAFEVRLVPDIKVSGDEHDLVLLVRNLLDNAVRYTPVGGTIRVDLHAGSHSAVLAIADTGPGIPAKDVPRIFERFYRVDRARARETGGTGLGLSIVRHIAESHGGTVTVRTELGRGSVFTVTLPATMRPGHGSNL